MSLSPDRLNAPSIPDIPESMQAALFYEPNVVRYETTPVPTLQPGEILIQVDTALTCGTDIKCYRRGHPVLLKTFPSPFGHEFAGTIVQICPESDDSESRFQIGDRVVAANSAPCYQCYLCRKGQYNLCEELDLLNGAYADYIRIPARIAKYNTHRIPDHIPFEVAAFAEPLSVCLHGVDQARVSPGDRVAVMGLGPIGQLIVRACKWKGAHVTALARTPHKLQTAQDFGMADQIANLKDYESADQLRNELTQEGRGFDIVIEAIGRPETWEQAIALVRKGGTVNLFGGCPGDSSISLSTRRLHYDEIKLVSSFHHTPYHFKKALDLLTTLEIDPRPLITDVLPMARFEAALQQVEAGEAMKIALKNGLRG